MSGLWESYPQLVYSFGSYPSVNNILRHRTRCLSENAEEMCGPRFEPWDTSKVGVPKDKKKTTKEKDKL